MSLEEYFRKRRKRNRYTQQQIADFIGVGQSTISRIENDCHNTT
jgi:transcriptional regulator with XRE-family HTH domain